MLYASTFPQRFLMCMIIKLALLINNINQAFCHNNITTSNTLNLVKKLPQTLLFFRALRIIRRRTINNF
jgi:hypothetical protein